MTVVYVDSPSSDAERRRRLFAGDLFVYSPTPRSLELIAFARELAEATFAPHFPPDAQHHLTGPAYVDLLAGLKPRFINHPRSAELVGGLLVELGMDPGRTYFDVPRLRTMTSEYLNAGLTLQFAPHRDTWFSAPMSQINFWLPVYDVEEANVMTFHPPYFAGAVRNSSRDYHYAEWVANGRAAAARQIETETRKQPELEQEIDRAFDLRVITPPGGVLLFSGAHLHATVPNISGRTRFSIDFRAVDLGDVRDRVGAPNVDSACGGTTLGDFRRVTDLAGVPEELIAAYDTAAA